MPAFPRSRITLLLKRQNVALGHPKWELHRSSLAREGTMPLRPERLEIDTFAVAPSCRLYRLASGMMRAIRMPPSDSPLMPLAVQPSVVVSQRSIPARDKAFEWLFLAPDARLAQRSGISSASQRSRNWTRRCISSRLVAAQTFSNCRLTCPGRGPSIQPRDASTGSGAGRFLPYWGSTRQPLMQSRDAFDPERTKADALL